MSAPNQPFSSRSEMVSAFSDHVSRGKAQLFASWGLDLAMGERGGSFFHDGYADKRWLNCHCNGGVYNLGHRNPRIVGALTVALEALDIGNSHLLSGHRAERARRLAATTGGRLKGAVLGVSGGEAVDVAIKAVRGTTGRPKVVSARGGYHGHTGLAVAAGDPQYRDPFQASLPGFEQVPFDDLDALDRAVGDDTAAVLLEPIPATLGLPIAAEGYLPRVSALCHERGAKLIVDEVQTGLGRTGRMWCYQHEVGTEPDLLVTGKGLSGGIYPMTATLMTEEVHQLFDDHPFAHVSTFGGAELGCATALAVLDVVEEPGFLDRVVAVSDRIAGELSSMPFEVRRRGLMMGLKLQGEQGGMVAAKLLIDAGVFVVYANNDPSVVQLLPPLTIADDEVTYLVERIRGALG